MDDYDKDQMTEIYVQETSQLVENLENIIIESEKDSNMGDHMNEIFRIVHTIKGNSMMMEFDQISQLAHVIEDLFDYLRTENPQNVNYVKLTSLVLEFVDFIKKEVIKIQNNDSGLEKSDDLKADILEFLESLKFVNGSVEKSKDIIVKEEKPKDKNFGKLYYVNFQFEDNCQMENIRAFKIIKQLEDIEGNIEYYPNKWDEEEAFTIDLKKHGFNILINTNEEMKKIEHFFQGTSFIQDIELKEVNLEKYEKARKLLSEGKLEAKFFEETNEKIEGTEKMNKEKKTQKYINVNVEKLDSLMNLVGELVVSEAMVTQNTEILKLNNSVIEKATNQMRKIINELQDTVMEIRMVPLAMTFLRMNRIVRDMSVKTNKDIIFETIGEETEVDKNIIDQIADPLMHLIRNAIDHGIETSEKRKAQGKSPNGKVILEAKHSGGDVWIIVKDDGKGLDKEELLNKAQEKNLLIKSKEEYTDKEIYDLILAPGFSTKEEITTFSGRGVGMDVVKSTIEKIGGNITINSEKNKGTNFIIRIPLTLAIIDGMVLKVGETKFTMPITTIKESFKAKIEDVVEDINGKEMIMLRGKCYSIIKLNEVYEIESTIQKIEDGILIMIESEIQNACIFADELIGEHQVVIKNFSKYLTKIEGISGCAHLGDGGISLILEPSSIIA